MPAARLHLKSTINQYSTTRYNTLANPLCRRTAAMVFLTVQIHTPNAPPGAIP